jgi:hypothetical protein
MENTMRNRYIIVSCRIAVFLLVVYLTITCVQWGFYQKTEYAGQEVTYKRLIWENNGLGPTTVIRNSEYETTTTNVSLRWVHKNETVTVETKRYFTLSEIITMQRDFIGGVCATMLSMPMQGMEWVFSHKVV